MYESEASVVLSSLLLLLHVNVLQSTTYCDHVLLNITTTAAVRVMKSNSAVIMMKLEIILHTEIGEKTSSPFSRSLVSD